MIQTQELRQFQWRPHLCACNIFTNDGSEQEDAHLLSPGVLAVGFRKITKHHDKQSKASLICLCLIPASFRISQRVDNFMQHGGGGHSVILKVGHWNHTACAGLYQIHCTLDVIVVTACISG